MEVIGGKKKGMSDRREKTRPSFTVSNHTQEMSSRIHSLFINVSIFIKKFSLLSAQSKITNFERTKGEKFLHLGWAIKRHIALSFCGESLGFSCWFFIIGKARSLAVWWQWKMAARKALDFMNFAIFLK